MNYNFEFTQQQQQQKQQKKKLLEQIMFARMTHHKLWFHFDATKMQKGKRNLKWMTNMN